MSTVAIYVENRQTGAHVAKNVPIKKSSNAEPETFESLWGNGITGNAIGANGTVPDGVKVVFGPPGNPTEYTIGVNPTVLPKETNVSNWLISAYHTAQK